MLISWGANRHGECCSGDNASALEREPRCVNATIRRSLGYARSVVDIAAGDDFTLLLLSSGDVYSCGRGQEGQLGVVLPLGVRNTRQPVLVEALRPWYISKIACGSKHSMAVSRCGEAFAWGLLLSKKGNSDVSFASGMQGLGRNFTEDLNAKEQRIVAESWTKYLNNSQSDNSPTGDDAVAFFQSSGCHRCPHRVPEKCIGLEGVRIRSISCGYAHSAVIDKEGVILTCGYNEKGQLGNGTRLPSPYFSQIALKDKGVCSIAGVVSCGQNHTAAISKLDGRLFTWGFGTFGQLGLGHDKKESCVPSVVSLHLAVLQVACGVNHTTALVEGGNVYAFGHRDALGGNSHIERLPELVRTLVPGSVKSVFAGGNASFVELDDAEAGLPHALYSWGYSENFQLGRSMKESSSNAAPTRLPRLAGMNVRRLAVGTYHCVALVDPPSASLLPPSLDGHSSGNATLRSMLADQVHHDVVVKAAGGESLLAHHCVLKVRCPKLADRASRIGIGGQAIGPSWELDLSAHQVATLFALLEYIYCDSCCATQNVAACLKSLAEELSLSHLAQSVFACTTTESSGSGIRWARTAAGTWAQVESDPTSLQNKVQSSYVKDLSALIVDGDSAETNDYVSLKVTQTDGGRSQIVQIARPLLTTSSFFGALLDGGFAEAEDLRSGFRLIEMRVDSVDAFILCLKILASGDSKAFPRNCHGLLDLWVEAHRLDFKDVARAAEQRLGEVVMAGSVDDEMLKAICDTAKLFDEERLAQEASAKVTANHAL